jgi:hypothetical protein
MGELRAMESDANSNESDSHLQDQPPLNPAAVRRDRRIGSGILPLT